MPNVQLVRLESAIEERLASDLRFTTALAEEHWVHAAEIVHEHIGRTLTSIPISVDELHWGGYFVVDESTREVVGSCAFKAPPTQDGTVEIAYFTYPEFERRGYGTEMAGRLIALARRSAAVRQVIAHTLPLQNASTRVLRRIGMTCVGEVVDPEDGNVWRWQLRVSHRTFD